MCVLMLMAISLLGAPRKELFMCCHLLVRHDLDFMRLKSVNVSIDLYLSEISCPVIGQ